MKWWLLGGGALGLVALAWYFGVAQIARAVLGFVGDTLAGFREWIGKPGSKLKALCAVMATMCAVLSLQSFQKGQQIIRIQTEFIAYREKTTGQIATLQGAITARDRRIAEFVRLAVEEKGKLDALAKQAQGAQAEAAVAKARAASSKAAYDRLWANRPQTCAAALDLMQSECSTLGDY